MKLLLVLGALSLVAVLVAAAVIRWRTLHRSGQMLELRPPATESLEPEAWVVFFRSLYGIARPWWKRWLVGQP